MDNKYYSDRYKQEVRGDALCGFWSRMDGGVCMGWPGGMPHPCPANSNGTGCPIFAMLELVNQRTFSQITDFDSEPYTLMAAM